MIYQNSGCDDGLKMKSEAYRICFFVNNQNIFFIKNPCSIPWLAPTRSSDIGEITFFTLDYQGLTERLLQTELMAHTESFNRQMKNFSGQSNFSLK
jgi:hypothetical protein